MSIKTIIAQASAPHMQRICTAIDELRAAVDAANADGFTFRLKFPEPDYATAGPGSAMDAAIRAQALDAVVSKDAHPVLEYKATIMEAPSA